MYPNFVTRFVITLTLIVSVVLGGACSASASNADRSANSKDKPAVSGPATSTIDIKPDSPAETVRVFYTRLREGKFREAIHLTNLRPAIEGLTDQELK